MWRSFSSCICVFMTCGLQVLSVEMKERKEYLSMLQEYPLHHRANAITLAVGADVTCAIMEYEAVKCFGRGEYGQLGDGSLENMGDTLSTTGINLPVLDLAISSIQQVAIGAQHSCALSMNGQLQCWGRNNSGELGRMDEDTRTVKFAFENSVEQVAAGDSFTCVLFTNARVLCFGKGSNGQLGQGSPLSNGDTISMPTILLGRRARQICCGLRHACAILDDGSVKCWGAGSFGQLGSGSSEDVGKYEEEMGNNLKPIHLGTNRTADQVSCGGEHTCVLLDNGQVKCFGKNDKGQLGLGDTIDRGRYGNKSHMGDHLPAVYLGFNKKATRLATGADVSCVVLDDRSAKCWGFGGHGQLLTGNSLNVGDHPGEMASLDPINLGMYTYNVSGIYAGVGGLFGHVCALVSANQFSPGEVICWGNGQFGQRGIGNNQSFGNLPHNTTLLPLVADLGPRRIPSASLFTELAVDLGPLPCTSEVGFRECRVVNVTKDVFLKNDRIAVYPQRFGFSGRRPIILVVQGNGAEYLPGTQLVSRVEFRCEGDIFKSIPTRSAFISKDGGGVDLELKVRGGWWMLESCPENQPYPGERSECHLWSTLSRVLYDIPKKRGKR